MSLDSRLRDELRQAVDAHDPRAEDALRKVKATQPADWAALTVVSLGEPGQSAPRARGQRIVGVLAACALLAGAIAVPVALRSRTRADARPAAGSSASDASCGPAVVAGYRSTAVVRVAAAPSASPPTNALPSPERIEPATFARGLCGAARSASHLGSGAGISLRARTNAAGDLLSLSVVTPNRNDTSTLARNWVNEFAVARRAEATDQVRAQQRLLTQRVQQLHRELRRVDTELARLMPGTYGNVVEFDEPTSNLPGPGAKAPPNVPERGSVHALNLAFERIQILSTLMKTGEQSASLRIAAVRPVVFASIVSVSPPALIRAPQRGPNAAIVVLAAGLLTGGVLLAGSAWWLGRRRRMRGAEGAGI